MSELEKPDIEKQGSIHKITYVPTALWALLITLYVFRDGLSLSKLLVALLVGYSPILIKRLEVKGINFYLTKNSLHFNQDILNRLKREIPLNKINDVEIKQNLFQKFVGAGDLIVLTANKEPLEIKNVNQVEEFEKKLTEKMSET